MRHQATRDKDILATSHLENISFQTQCCHCHWVDNPQVSQLSLDFLLEKQPLRKVLTVWTGLHGDTFWKEVKSLGWIHAIFYVVYNKSLILFSSTVKWWWQNFQRQMSEKSGQHWACIPLEKKWEMCLGGANPLNLQRYELLWHLCNFRRITF